MEVFSPETVPVLSTPIKRIYHRIAVKSIFFISGLCFASWASRIPNIQQALHLNNAELGSMLLCIPTGSMLSLPLAGWFIASYGSRKTTIGAAISYCLVLALIGLTQTKLELGLTLFLFGISGNTLNIAMNTQAIGVENLYQYPIMSSFHGMWSLAGLSGAAIGTTMINLHLPPSQHFIIIGMSGLTILLFTSWFTLKSDVAAKEKQKFFTFPDKSLLALGLLAFCGMICEGTMYDWSGVYFARVIKTHPGLVTAGYTLFTLSMAFGRLSGDWLTKRIGIRRMFQYGGAAVGTGLLLLVMAPYFIPAMAGCLIIGLGIATIVPLVYSAAAKSSIYSPGYALAAVSTIGYLGFLSGPPVIGYIAEYTNLRISFALVACLGLAITVMAKRVKLG